jgi:restriction endonuclease
MTKPLPKDFQLTDRDLLNLPHEREALERQNKRINNKLGYAVFLTIYAILVGILWSSVRWFALCGALPASFIAALIFAEKGDAVMKRFNREPSDALKRYEAFRAAEAQYEYWFIKTQEEFWNLLSGDGFEIEVLQLLNKAGFRARLTGGAGDGGVDLVLDDGTIIQCKAHSGPCGPSVLRELFGSLHHFGATKAILISRAGFTTGAVQFVEGKPITLWDRHDLMRLQRDLE